jgi:hypothetical protein
MHPRYVGRYYGWRSGICEASCRSISICILRSTCSYRAVFFAGSTLRKFGQYFCRTAATFASSFSTRLDQSSACASRRGYSHPLGGATTDFASAGAEAKIGDVVEIGLTVLIGPYSPSAPVDQQFRNPVHCVHLSNDGLVYVCDRVNDRIQVFTKQGKFLKEFFLRKETLGNGSVWELAFSRDRDQKFLLIADGENNVIWTLLRSDGSVLGQTGHNGRNAGQFHWVHQMASDSDGNLYTGEVDTGKRIQKFVLAH